MGKYMIKAHYTTDGAKGVLKGGGTARRAAVEEMVNGLGGTVDDFFFAFGQTDVYTVVDLPDNETAAAVALVVGASGAVAIETVVLLTAEEIDGASHRSVDYHPPGD